MSTVYKKNFIREALIRIDFAVPVEGIKTNLPGSIRKAMLKNFKVFNKEQVNGEEILVNNGVLERKVIKDINWCAYGRNREKRISLTHSNIIISLKEYSSYRTMKLEFMHVLEALIKEYPDLQMNRVGLRYVNEISLDGANPTDWKEFINEKLLGGYDLYNDKVDYSRVLSNIEYMLSDFRISFQYGMHNPDYPTKIKRKLFLLDFDGYMDGYIENIGEVNTFLDNSHKKIEEIFEISITSKLKEKMNE